MEETNARPGGSASATATPTAAAGPQLATATTKYRVSPTSGDGLLASLATTRSDTGGVTTAEAELLPGAGSNWSECVIVAVLTCATGLITRAKITSASGTPRLTVPTLQVPVVGLYAPWLGVSARNDRPAGTTSVTRTFVAALGPMFASLTV